MNIVWRGFSCFTNQQTMADFVLNVKIPSYFQVVQGNWERKNFSFVLQENKHTPTWEIWSNSNDEHLFDLSYNITEQDQWQFTTRYHCGIEDMQIIIEITQQLEMLSMVAAYIKLEKENGKN